MFRGSMVAMVTPMTDDGEIDVAGLERLVDFHVEQGTDAIVAVGTTGESATLDHEEHCHVMRLTVQFARGRIPVIGGTGSNSTREAISLTRCAMEGGCDAALLVTPYYNKPTQEGMYRHFMAVAEAVPIPQILYNVPGRTACCLRPSSGWPTAPTSSASRRRPARSSAPARSSSAAGTGSTSTAARTPATWR